MAECQSQERIMPQKRCPKCGLWYHYQSYDVDFIHGCMKSQGSSERLQRREEHHFQGSRITLKIDEPWWDQIGINPHQPDPKLTHTKFKNQFKRLTTVDWFIDLDLRC